MFTFEDRMNSKPYKIIFTLLISSFVAIIVLQSFWISNFYNQKLEEFNSHVFQSLAEISVKLNEREQIQYVKESILPRKESKIIKKGNSVKVIVSAASASATTENVPSDLDIIHELKLDTVFSNENHELIVSDSLVQINNGRKMVIVNKHTASAHKVPGKKELNKLLDKMLTEIKTIDVSPVDDIEPDSLKSIITKVNQSKGIVTPFEFCLKKETKEIEEIMACSQGFKKDDANVFRFDLSNNKVFSNHNFLYLQFPDVKAVVFSRMKNILILSSLFSLIIILIFFYTIRTILKQKKLSEIKNDFINNMTHELKTPIATISLAVDAINNPQVKNDDEKFSKYTSILKEENQKLNSHVERVLQMALLDKGELQLRKQKVNAVELINTTIKTYKLQIAEQKAQVVFEPKEQEVIIYADEFHLQSVFNNLLDNALKYSKQNSIIEMSVLKKGTNVLIKFKDNGIGIDPSMHKKVFEKFYRVQSGIIHDVKGFGLGLSYVKSIIEKHGGTISLESDTGSGREEKGSVFLIKLPCNES